MLVQDATKSSTADENVRRKTAKAPPAMLSNKLNEMPDSVYNDHGTTVGKEGM